ncbi:hypothetical protein Celal_3870 [Cellulophaga algicola DSM 14237]|uniref:Uncharacterized protein n=1 Tax=Cellulophaga algicola (strain DSM 14237 / IC166 / ACAM 630) TaxID=688270 RepID=E6XC63_CELAD|nr:hypothetical protein Celal_3870 [Cellulophaga algicola DSM 14237]
MNKYALPEATIGAEWECVKNRIKVDLELIFP